MGQARAMGQVLGPVVGSIKDIGNIENIGNIQMAEATCALGPDPAGGRLPAKCL